MSLSGVLTASGTLGRKISKALAGIANFIGTLFGYKVRSIPITVTLYSRDFTATLYSRDITVTMGGG